MKGRWRERIAEKESERAVVLELAGSRESEWHPAKVIEIQKDREWEARLNLLFSNDSVCQASRRLMQRKPSGADKRMIIRLQCIHAGWLEQISGFYSNHIDRFILASHQLSRFLQHLTNYPIYCDKGALAVLDAKWRSNDLKHCMK